MTANEVKKGNVKIVITYKDTTMTIKGYCNGKVYGDVIYIKNAKYKVSEIVSMEVEQSETKQIENNKSEKEQSKEVEYVQVVYRNNKPCLVSKLDEYARKAIQYACGETTEFGKVYNFTTSKAKSLGLI